MTISPPDSVKAEGIFLSLLFKRLFARQVRYAVMRNYEHLPFSCGGSDLDIMVDPDDAKFARLAVREAIHAAGGAQIGIAESVGFFKVHALGTTQGGAERWWGLCVDVNFGLCFRGHPLIASHVPMPVRWHNGIVVLADEVAALLGVLKEVLNNAIVPARYLEAARSMTQEGWAEMADLLAPMGKDALVALQRLVGSAVPTNEISGECLEVRKLFLREAFFRRPLLSVVAGVAYEWYRLRRYLQPSGVVLAILGVDGSGKSTVINAILPILNAATHHSVFVQHLRPGFLPPLGRLRRNKQFAEGTVVDPHGSRPSSALGSLLRLSYLSIDYFLGYWLITRVRIAKGPAIVIFDRYAYDMALDPRRFRIGLSGRIARRFAALAPKPDLIICLHGTPETIAERKKELPVVETRRQVEALRAFASGERRAILISTDSSVEETRETLLRGLLHYLKRVAPL